MKKIGFFLLVSVMLMCMAAQGWAEDAATREEVVSKCLEAAKVVESKGVDAAIRAIGDKKGPFVWKDTYVFLMDMDGKMLAHPMRPELTQRDNLTQVTDSAGKPLFLEFIELANSQGKGWVNYMWPKPGQEKPASKSSYIYRVPGTQYLVGAGIYR